MELIKKIRNLNIKKLLNNREFVINIIIILSIIGVLFMTFAKLTKKNSFKYIQNSQNNEVDYEKKMKYDLENIISNISGVGNTKVFITFENTKEIIYATEGKQNNEKIFDESNGSVKRKKTGDKQKKYITTKDSDGNEHPVILTEILPKIKGVVIVCEGGGDPNIRNEITETIASVFNIMPVHIHVAQLK
ncbi:MAG: stage III sporulation protein AG [Candidatus Improbicoccus devescovinae]|nr:MAG: stage III sporulation protein AG [Candidatus Improbicoccus devescovinae]